MSPAPPVKLTSARFKIGVPGGAAAAAAASKNPKNAAAARRDACTKDEREETARAEQLRAAPPCREGAITGRGGAVPLESRGRAAAAAPIQLRRYQLIVTWNATVTIAPAATLPITLDRP